MSSHTDVELWERIKKRVTAGEKGGKAGQWSAIKAMIASKEYKAAGGGYVGKPNPRKGLLKWIGEDWRTKSGGKSLETGERFLPAKAIAALTPAQYKRTSDIKRRDLKKGKQFSKQPKDIEDIADRFR
jgi:hypothetical protein